MEPFINLNKRFTFKDFIGYGTYGEVYEVEETGEVYALKMHKLNNETIIDPVILREIKVLSEFDHPNIIRILEVFFATKDDTKYLCILMKKCKMLMYEYIMNYNLTVDEIIQLFLKIVDALNYIHQRKYYHGDLSFGNILMDDDLQPVVIDFGFCKSFYSIFDAELPPGISVRPIECFPNKNIKVNTKTLDSWALGCILYFMFEKEIPILNKKLEFDANVKKIKKKDNIVYHILKKLINHNPRKRLTLKQLTELDDVLHLCSKYKYQFRKYEKIIKPIKNISHRFVHQIREIMKDNGTDDEVLELTFNYMDKLNDESAITLYILFWISNAILSTHAFEINCFLEIYNFNNPHEEKITIDKFTNKLITTYYITHKKFDLLK